MGPLINQNRQDPHADNLQSEDWKLDREDFAGTDRISSFEAMQLATMVGENRGAPECPKNSTDQV
jgi:hypothetical protein